MDNTLETITLVHRLILAASLALFLVGISTDHPNRIYDDATHEIDSLEEGVEAVSEQVDHAYKAIYDKSELKSAALAWLKRHHAQEQDIYIEVVSPEEFLVPDSRRDPLVTLDAQVKWADRVYRELDYPFFLCQVDGRQLQHALDTLAERWASSRLTQLRVYVHSETAPTSARRLLSCKIEASYEVHDGTTIAIRSAMLELPTTVVNVIQVEPPGPKWFDLSVQDTFKEHGLGDWEDSEALVIPSLWELWSDLGDRSPAAAEAFLDQKKGEEAERLKEKLDILGESLNRSVTIILASLVELCLMIYLLGLLYQIGSMTQEYKAAITESAFYGIMRTRVGWLVTVTSFIIPFAVSFFVLIIAFPAFRPEWPGPRWMVAGSARWSLMILLGITDLLLIIEMCRTAAILEPWSRKIAGTETAGSKKDQGDITGRNDRNPQQQL